MKALIIGGTKGFGKEVSQLLLDQKWDLITVGRTEGDFPNTQNFLCDVGNLEEWKNVLGTIEAENQTIDLVIFIAGFARAKNAKDLTVEDWEEHTRKNLIYVALGLESIKSSLVKSTNPKIVTIGSQWSYKIGAYELVPYTITKHAVDTLTKDFAARNTNIKANHYCVPTMDTPQYIKVQESFSSIGKDYPVKDVAIPKEVAKSIIDHVTRYEKSGSTLVVDKISYIISENI